MNQGAMPPLPAEFMSAVRAHGLVIIAGAGVSMLPPTSLPNWRDFNRSVLEALGERVGRETNPSFVAERIERILGRREVERAYQPDFMAQLIEEEIGADYFRVLQALDAEAFNRNHELIAALAHAGVVRAIITTNFDRLIERALAAAGVTPVVFASREAFDTLGDALAQGDGPLHVIKAHGSVDAPESMVDTLAQRVRGRPTALNAAVATLLTRHVALSIGFSGADLDYDPEYLGLRSAAHSALGFTVLRREKDEPLAAMRELVESFGDRATFHVGSLPESLGELAVALGVEVPAVPVDLNSNEAVDLQARLVESTRSWVDALGPMAAINAFISLLDAAGDDPWMIDFMLYFRRYYRTEEHTGDPWQGSPAYWRYEYQFGRRLMDRGRHVPEQHELDDGRRLLSSQVIAFRQYEDALNLLSNAATRGNLFVAEVALSELIFWVYGPGRAVAHAQQTWQRLAMSLENKPPSDIDFRAAVETSVGISRVFELAGEYDLAFHASQAAITNARHIGDEPRRAAALIQAARTLACWKKYDDAERVLAEAARVAGRLSLGLLQTDVQAARGMLDVLRSRDALAVEPLSLACAGYRIRERLPRLFITLLDLARAAFYTGDNELLTNTQLELHSLCDLFPRAEGLMTLLKMEMARHNEEWEHVGPLTTALEAFCTDDPEYPWRWGMTRVERYRAMLDKR